MPIDSSGHLDRSPRGGSQPHGHPRACLVDPELYDHRIPGLRTGLVRVDRGGVALLLGKAAVSPIATGLAAPAGLCCGLCDSKNWDCSTYLFGITLMAKVPMFT